ncbi:MULTISPECIES: hypothetical protein [Pseudanabaena]|nr:MULTISPECIES: hypothetical protein [Pseudanabaena]MEA5489452.1 hypothetical protein [Pseudanabaena sp. CCNP1317]WGS71529.1 hypothetical protein OA858_17700 [Pseudanabaena galeata CCNP1313]
MPSPLSAIACPCISLPTLSDRLSLHWKVKGKAFPKQSDFKNQ